VYNSSLEQERKTCYLFASLTSTGPPPPGFCCETALRLYTQNSPVHGPSHSLPTHQTQKKTPLEPGQKRNGHGRTKRYPSSQLAMSTASATTSSVHSVSLPASVGRPKKHSAPPAGAPAPSREVVRSPVRQRERSLALVGDVVAHPLPLEPLPVGEHADALPVSQAPVPAASSSATGIVGRQRGSSSSSSSSKGGEVNRGGSGACFDVVHKTVSARTYVASEGSQLQLEPCLSGGRSNRPTRWSIQPVCRPFSDSFENYLWRPPPPTTSSRPPTPKMTDQRRQTSSAPGF